MTRCMLPVSLLAVMLSTALWVQVATSVRVDRPTTGLPRGNVIVTVDGQERTITGDAWDAWLIRGGRSVVWNGSDGAGGFENEGQSLWRYDVATGKKKKLLSEFFMIHKVVESPTRSGKTALLISMTDGGLGAPHIAVVDPDRGEVWRMRGARFVGVRNGRIAVAANPLKDFGSDVLPPPKRILYYDLDKLLKRPASAHWPVGVPRIRYE